MTKQDEAGTPRSRRGGPVLSVERIDLGRLPGSLAPDSRIARELREESPDLATQSRPDPRAEEEDVRRSRPPVSRLMVSPMTKVLAPFLTEEWHGLTPGGKPFSTSATPSMQQKVLHAARSIGLDAINVCVLQMKTFKDLYLGLPLSIRDEAMTGLTCGLDAGLSHPLCKQLELLTGLAPDRPAVATMPEKDAFLSVASKIDNSAGGLLPQSVLDVVSDLLLFAVYARVRGDEAFRSKLFPFMQMLETGHLPVGMTVEQVFIVVTL